MKEMSKTSGELGILLTQTEQFVLRLLANELNGIGVPSNPADIDWAKLLEISRRHAITSLLYASVKKIPCVPEHVISSLRSAAISTAMNNEQKLRTQEAVLTLLNQNGIRCAVLKGSSVAVHYPHPELRYMGDIDVLIDPDELDKTHMLLENTGYRYKENNHPYHREYVDQTSQTLVEIHFAVTKFQPVKKAQHLALYMTTALDQIDIVHLGKYEIPVLSYTQQLVSLLLHMEMHMYHNEIGLRQLCDWAVMRKAMPENQSDCLAETDRFAEYGLQKFANALDAVCCNTFGITNGCNDITSETWRRLLRHLLDGGNLITPKQNEHTHLADAAYSKRDTNIITRYIRTINEKARREYACARHYALLPFFWGYYPYRWLIRTLTGKRVKTSAVGIWRTADEKKSLSDELEIFR